MSCSKAGAHLCECALNGSSLQCNLIEIYSGSADLPSLGLFMLLLSKKGKGTGSLQCICVISS